jgi:flagellar hook assembly protein FlgD
VDADGSSHFFEPLSVVLKAPERLSLHQNYPNPFNPTTTLAFEIPASQPAAAFNVVIYDMLGRKIRGLIHRQMGAGYFRHSWDGRNDDGNLVGSGIYLAVLTWGEYRLVRKMIKIQ